MYRKREGTSGIKGQLYETKLISLINFRAKIDNSLKECYLATNMADIGTFDDICFRAKAKIGKNNKQIAIFIQAKHREANKTVLTLNSANDLSKWFASYLTIKRSFKQDTKDVFFKGTFQDIDSYFIMYTTAKDDRDNERFNTEVAHKLNNLIATGNDAVQPNHNERHVEFLCDIVMKEQLVEIATIFAEFVNKNDNTVLSITNDLILIYHVILAKKFFLISEIRNKNEDSEHRIARFRMAFGNKDLTVRGSKDTNDDFTADSILVKVKNKMVEMLLQSTPGNIVTIDKNVEKEFSKINIHLASIVGNILITDQNSEYMKFSDNTDTLGDIAKQLFSELQSAIPNLQDFKFNVDVETFPVLSFEKIHLIEDDIAALATTIGTFLNKNTDSVMPTTNNILRRYHVALTHKVLDISEIIGEDDDVYRLATFQQDFFESEEDTLVLFKRHLYAEVLRGRNLHENELEGSLEQPQSVVNEAVKNILMNREFKVSTAFGNKDIKLKKSKAEKRLDHLKMKLCELMSKSSDDKVVTIEKSGDDEKVAKDFLNRLLFYTNQADERGVEKRLKDEIEDHQCLNVDSIKVTTDAIFLQYHDQIQQWWMLKEAEYLTKKSSHYEDALKLIVDKPLLSVFIVKLMQSLNKFKHTVMDLEDLLQTKDYSTLVAELTKIEQNKIIILACDNIQRSSNKRLENISNILNEKRIIIVTKNTAVLDTVQIYFKDIKEIRDDRCSLADMSEKSQKTVLQAKVNFQDVEVTLDTIVDEESMQTVEGVVLNDFINNETRCFSNSVTNVNYEKVKHLYVDRRVCKPKEDTSESTISIERVTSGRETNCTISIERVLFDLNDLSKVVLLIAEPGMGKSTLLTHLSIKTKESNPATWIARVNLLDHCEKFNKWQENKVRIDILETLKFLCPIIVGGNGNSDLEFDLEESEGEVQLKSCCTDNPWTVFEIKMFLDYFNRKELIFLFDGFDEICPLYTEEVMSLLKVVRNYTNRHVMWITSRFYEKVMSRLKQEFDLQYEVKGFNNAELDEYLWKYWQSTIILRTLNKLCFNFLHYLRKELNICPDDVMQTFNLFFYDCTHSFQFVYHFDTPLHLYLCANYFQEQVNYERIKPNRWNLDINSFTVYDNFIETKLKTIRFQEKNKIDLHNPDNLTIYENIREDFFVKHYKLGAYAVFNQDLSKIFDEKELSKIRKTIENIKIGTEKTGLVQSIINGIPTFIHRTFTEYFAVEYICQLLKSATGTESQRKIWDFILNVLFLKCDRNIGEIFNCKLKTDNVLKAKETKKLIYIRYIEESSLCQAHQATEMYRDDARRAGRGYDLFELGAPMWSSLMFDFS
ncbi:hypothetical protein SFRURICE_015450 [Spodoptera frugiperda]|nr:hypothetical protein SFRURICE_015450 [Spodoptera frugiperda]